MKGVPVVIAPPVNPLLAAGARRIVRTAPTSAAPRGGGARYCRLIGPRRDDGVDAAPPVHPLLAADGSRGSGATDADRFSRGRMRSRRDAGMSFQVSVGALGG